jgi:hydrogenase maturation protease
MIDRFLQRQGKILVLGVGNPLCGDDGAGNRVAELLINQKLPEGVQVVEAGTPGLELPLWLEGWSSVVLVDAVNMGLTPGSWQRFSPDDIQILNAEGSLSLHQSDLATGLALSDALDMLPEHLIIYGIEPQITDPGEGLSPVVSNNLPGLVNQILDDLRE